MSIPSYLLNSDIQVGNMERPQEDTENLGWSDVTYRPTNRGTLEQQHTAYQRVLHKHALSRLETELRGFVQTMPRRELPKYDPVTGASPVALIPPHQRVPKDAEMADRVYSRSAVQRYVLQLLAAELHAPLEDTRQFVPFETFRDVLQAPNAVDLSKLNPQVNDRTMVDTSPPSWAKLSGLTPPSLLGRSQTGGQPPPTLAGGPLPQSIQGQQRQTPDAEQLPEHQRSRTVVDSASFLNMHRGVRVRSYKAV